MFTDLLPHEIQLRWAKIPHCSNGYDLFVPVVTFSIWHFLSQNPESSQGWYIPKVTQLIIITVIVNRSK